MFCVSARKCLDMGPKSIVNAAPTIVLTTKSNNESTRERVSSTNNIGIGLGEGKENVLQIPDRDLLIDREDFSLIADVCSPTPAVIVSENEQTKKK